MSVAGHLVVDGYNVLHAWPDTAALINLGQLAAARERLVERLREHQGQTGLRVTVVFDARHAERGAAAFHGGVEVVFTDREHSADQVIERLVFRHANRSGVRVASSDQLIASMVLRQGADWISTPDLLAAMTESESVVGGGVVRSRRDRGSLRLEHRVGGEVRRRLEELRLGPDQARRRRDATLSALLTERLVAVVRAPLAAQALDMARAAHRGGIRVVEVTTATPDFDGVIEELVDDLGPGSVVGVGTVLTSDQAARAKAAGARFAVSPVGRPEVVEHSARLGMVAIPAAFSPAEAWRAHAWGAALVKVFPMTGAGLARLQWLSHLFPVLRLLASGGADASNLGAYRRAGAAVVAAAGAIFPEDAVRAGDWRQVESGARALVGAMRRLPA
ncbi:MAG: NYN domain-containing protein [Candidatus Dormibacteria bacterium]